MNKGFYIAFVIIGVVLLIFGFQAADSFQSDVSEAFTGTPSDRSVWFFAIGLVALLGGVGALLLGRR